MTKTEYKWTDGTLADYVLRRLVSESESTTSSSPAGFVMKSGVQGEWTAWLAKDTTDHTGNRMEFYDVETAKAWVFTQVRMNDSAASLITN